jgi:hypothetical protein
MKALKVIGMIIVSLLPFTWMFTFRTWLVPLVGNFWGQIGVVAMAVVVMLIGVQLFRHGYGEGSSAENNDE